MRTNLLLIVITLAALATSAHAQPAPAPAPAPDTATPDYRNRDRARMLATEAAALFRAGDRRAAVLKFEEAYALYPTPALLYNIGKAYAGLSDHVRAHRALSRFLRESPVSAASAADTERRAEVTTLLAELTPHVGVANITAPAFAGATLELDGIALGIAPLPAPLAVPPGVHEITARQDDVLVARKRVTIAGGGRPDIELTRVEDDLEKVFITKEVASRPVYKRWWFWTAIGATVASSVALYIATNPREVNEVGSPPLGSLGLDDFTPR